MAAIKLNLKGQKVWAIGMGDWIEIRAHPTPPKKVSTKAQLKAGRARRVYDDYGGYKMSSLKVLEVCIFNGGSVLGCIKHNRYIQLTGVILKKNDIIEFPSAKVTQLMTYLWKD